MQIKKKLYVVPQKLSDNIRPYTYLIIEQENKLLDKLKLTFNKCNICSNET